MNKKPLVAIWTMTYNHGPYVKECLDGIIMQQAKFPFVAIVHDDCSTDSTISIIKEYAEKYPDIIKPIFEEENQHSKHNGSLDRIKQQALESTGAKYIAVCEGDDYWTDPYKLQTQVDFLESHPEYSLCFHSVKVHNEGVDNILQSCNNIETRQYYPNEILGKWTIPTCSAVLRTQCISKSPKHPDFIVGDNVLWASCLTNGKCYGFNKEMGVYRRNPNSWTNKFLSTKSARYKTLKGWVRHYSAMRECFPQLDKQIFDNLILYNLSTLTIIDLCTNWKGLYSYFFPSLKQYKLLYLKSIFVRGILIAKGKIIK